MHAVVKSWPAKRAHREFSHFKHALCGPPGIFPFQACFVWPIGNFPISSLLCEAHWNFFPLSSMLCVAHRELSRCPGGPARRWMTLQLLEKYHSISETIAWRGKTTLERVFYIRLILINYNYQRRKKPALESIQ